MPGCGCSPGSARGHEREGLRGVQVKPVDESYFESLSPHFVSLFTIVISIAFTLSNSS